MYVAITVAAGVAIINTIVAKAIYEVVTNPVIFITVYKATRNTGITTTFITLYPHDILDFNISLKDTPAKVIPIDSQDKGAFKEARYCIGLKSQYAVLSILKKAYFLIISPSITDT